IGERSTQWVEEISATERYRYRNDQYNLAKVNSGEENTSKNPVRPVIEVPLNLIEDAYVVRFNPNGGTMNNEYKLVKKGSTLGTLPTATRANYELENWYTSLDFIIPIDENTIPNGYNTYYAKWVGNVSAGIINHDSFILEPNEENDITFSNASEIESLTYESSDDDIVTVNNNGHLVAISEGDAIITITGTKSHLTRTVNVKVVNESNTFIVSFDSQGGSQVSDIPVTKNTALGVLPSAPTKSEYDFGGWFTNTNYSVEVTVDTIITGNVTFYALWIPTNAVAEINRSYFTSVQAAVDSEMTGKTTIKLLKDVSYTTKIDLFDKNTTKDIVLDLQGHTITNTSTNAIRTKATLEIKNGTIIGTSANGTIDIGSGGYLVINSGRIENSGERAAIYNDGGTVEIGETAYITTNAQWKSDNNRGSVQNKSGTTTITGGTIINTRSSDSYAVSVSVGTLVIGTKNNAYDTENLILQGETGGIYSNVNYSLYDGIIKGKTVAVNDENKITSIEDGSFKINDTGDNYNVLYYTLEIPKYKIEFDA
ncbi:MAG: InlB B-repeat-containing protein, partial [Bacilli bacterium]|nr:InlB B-repeat-containing protein [Bacilli bacterium]